VAMRSRRYGTLFQLEGRHLYKSVSRDTQNEWGLPCGWEKKWLIFGLGNCSSNPRCERKCKNEAELHDCEGVLEMTESSDNIANKYSFDKNIIGTENP